MSGRIGPRGLGHLARALLVSALIMVPAAGAPAGVVASPGDAEMLTGARSGTAAGEGLAARLSRPAVEVRPSAAAQEPPDSIAPPAEQYALRPDDVGPGFRTIAREEQGGGRSFRAALLAPDARILSGHPLGWPDLAPSQTQVSLVVSTVVVIPTGREESLGAAFDAELQRFRDLGAVVEPAEGWGSEQVWSFTAGGDPIFRRGIMLKQRNAAAVVEIMGYEQLATWDRVAGLMRTVEYRLGSSVAAAPDGPGEVVVVDAFDSDGFAPPGWQIDGELRMRAARDQGASLILGRPPLALANVSIAIDVRLVGDPERPSVGVACRETQTTSPTTPRDYYELVVQPGAGRFFLHGMEGGSARLLVPPTASDAILRGNETNRLELRCIGPTITAAINGTQVASAGGAAVRPGGLFLSLSSRGDAEAEARFDNLEVRRH